MNSLVSNSTKLKSVSHHNYVFRKHGIFILMKGSVPSDNACRRVCKLHRFITSKHTSTCIWELSSTAIAAMCDDETFSSMSQCNVISTGLRPNYSKHSKLRLTDWQPQCPIYMEIIFITNRLHMTVISDTIKTNPSTKYGLLSVSHRCISPLFMHLIEEEQFICNQSIWRFKDDCLWYQQSFSACMRSRCQVVSSLASWTSIKFLSLNQEPSE